jgi:hypothetical protein
MTDPLRHDLEIKFLRRLMARDAAIWAARHGTALPSDRITYRNGVAQPLPSGHEAITVLAEWHSELRNQTNKLLGTK